MDKNLAGFGSAGSSAVYHELFAGSTDLIVSGKVTLKAGQNLKRGALLGKITTGGKYVLSTSAASDGSQAPVAILVHDTDATAADTEVNIYIRGNFNTAAMTFGTGHTADSVKEALHDKGIILVKTIA